MKQVRQKKTNTVSFHLHVESRKQNRNRLTENKLSEVGGEFGDWVKR